MSVHGTVSPSDQWMPDGFDGIDEAQLHQAPRLLSAALCRELASWWLLHDRPDERTPNWDITSTCTIEGRRALLLVEAKAHDHELFKEAAARTLITRDTGSQAARETSHETIKVAIDQARAGLAAATGWSWGICRDSHYQMSNRFAWAWKVAQLGTPVVLVYLGIIAANEVEGPPSRLGTPFPDAEAWEDLVRSHARGIVPDEVWRARMDIGGTPMIPLIGSVTRSIAE